MTGLESVDFHVCKIVDEVIFFTVQDVLISQTVADTQFMCLQKMSKIKDVGSFQMWGKGKAEMRPPAIKQTIQDILCMSTAQDGTFLNPGQVKVFLQEYGYFLLML